MQNDDIVWSIINKSFCSFKISTTSRKFCRNEYNLTGICSRSGCPLANSQYATVREEEGKCYLYVRTAERSFFPVKQWEKIRLSKNFKTALQQIDENLLFWKAYFRQKCRQRFLKITQYLTRMRKLKLYPEKTIIPIRKRIDTQIRRKEEKALVAARIDNAIEAKLLQRLKEGTYDRIYNFPKEAFGIHTREGEEEEEIEKYGEEEIEEETEASAAVRQKVKSMMEKETQAEEEEESEDETVEHEYVADFDESDEEIMEEDIEDLDFERAASYLKEQESDEERVRPIKKRKLDQGVEEQIKKDKLKKMLNKKPQLQIEYEEEEEERVAQPIKLKVRRE